MWLNHYQVSGAYIYRVEYNNEVGEIDSQHLCNRPTWLCYEAFFFSKPSLRECNKVCQSLAMVGSRLHCSLAGLAWLTECIYHIKDYSLTLRSKQALYCYIST